MVNKKRDTDSSLKQHITQTPNSEKRQKYKEKTENILYTKKDIIIECITKTKAMTVWSNVPFIRLQKKNTITKYLNFDWLYDKYC